MEASEYIGSTVSGLVYLALGFCLVRLGARTRSATEWALGSAFLCWGLYYILRIVSIRFQSQPILESQAYITASMIDCLGSISFCILPTSRISPRIDLGEMASHHPRNEPDHRNRRLHLGGRSQRCPPAYKRLVVARMVRLNCSWDLDRSRGISSLRHDSIAHSAGPV